MPFTEGSFTGSYLMNDYVLFNKETLQEALFGVGLAIWMTEEFVGLIKSIIKFMDGNFADYQYFMYLEKDVKDLITIQRKTLVKWNFLPNQKY